MLQRKGRTTVPSAASKRPKAQASEGQEDEVDRSSSTPADNSRGATSETGTSKGQHNDEQPASRSVEMKGKKPSGKKGKRQPSDLKAYPKAVDSALQNKQPIRANRRGIVPLHSDSEKPSFTISEMYKMCKAGLSFKMIGKKIGIDPSREEVLGVYEVFYDHEDGLLDIEAVQAPSKINPPTPLWYMFESELDVVAANAIPDPADILSHNLQQRVKERLGTHAPHFLDAYLEVGDIINEELAICTLNASPQTRLGKLSAWTNHLPRKLLSSSWQVQRSIAQASYQLSGIWAPGEGRCKCGSSLKLCFSWRDSPIAHASFFWGCVSYPRADVHRHDKASPCRGYLRTVIAEHYGRLGDAEMTALIQNIQKALDVWQSLDQESPDSETDIESKLLQARKLYGGPDMSCVQSVCATLTKFRDFLSHQLEKRPTTSAASAGDP